jgi:hypothetical protein
MEMIRISRFGIAFEFNLIYKVSHWFDQETQKSFERCGLGPNVPTASYSHRICALWRLPAAFKGWGNVRRGVFWDRRSQGE